MKITELRIGNLINNSNEVIAISAGESVSCYGLSFSGMVHFTFNKIEPIKLTEEWLIKLGFERCFDHWGGYLSPDFGERASSLRIYEEDGSFYHQTNLEKIKLEYVHKLQNLYFVFSEKELELKK